MNDFQMNRRQALIASGLGTLSLGMPGVVMGADKVDSSGNAVASEKSCIFVLLCGGPSHVDTWDMKPGAPEEVRGIFRPIQTSAPGMVCCEHLPGIARVMDRLCVVRGMHHGMTNHNAAAVEALCGRTPARGDLELLADDELSFPCHGAVVEHMLGKSGKPLTSVALPHVMRNVVRLPGQDAGLLGPNANPFQLELDPTRPKLDVGVIDLPADVPIERLAHREQLLAGIDAEAHWRSQSSMHAYHQRAFGLLRSAAVRGSLDLSQEPDNVRDRYGRHRLGQSLLLARRMVEAGVSLVTVYDGINNGQDANWDSHASVFPRMTDHLLPPADQGFSALVEDLTDRGMLDRTLVLAMGEFGRTPKINASAGRDHWPHCYSVLLAGGGIVGGRAHGSSDRWGAYPDSSAMTPGELAATLYWALGIDPHTEVHDQLGRPFTLAAGEPVHELFAG